MNSTNEVYNAFAGHGFSFELAVIFGIKAFLALCGMFTNGSLVLVTVLNKNLHMPCNILIALNAFCTVLAMLNPWITFGVVLTGQNFIPLGICVYFQLIPMAASIYQFLFFLLIAIDRLIGVLFPIWYMSRKTMNYLFVKIVLCSFVVFYIMMLDYTYAIENGNRYAPDIISPSPIVYSAAISMNILSTMCYIVLWLIMIPKHKAANQYTRRIILSVSVSFLVEFFGWLTNNILRYVISWLSVSQLKSWYISQFSGYFLLIVLVFYAPIFYLFSAEYRKAFIQIFMFKNSKTATVHVVSMKNKANVSAILRNV